MKRLFSAIAVLLLLSFSISAQTIVKDAQGNYTAVKKDSTKAPDTNTGKTFTDTKGNKWPVYQTNKGRVYALRTSKNGTTYKQYLDKPAKKVN